MVGHQAVGMKRPIELIRHRAEDFKEIKAIFTGEEYCLFGIPPDGDVVNCPFVLNSKWSRHYGSDGIRKKCGIARPDPKEWSRGKSPGRKLVINPVTFWVLTFYYLFEEKKRGRNRSREYYYGSFRVL
jgi:hypothetical protein